MTLKDICVSLDLAKQLKEAGYKQDSLFLWEIGLDNKPYLVKSYSANEADMSRLFSAPTASEIGERLPIELNSGRYTIERCDGYWELRFYEDAEQDLEGLYDWHDEEYTEANARAKMWLYLKENNLL